MTQPAANIDEVAFRGQGVAITSQADARVIRRAIRRRWPVTSEMRTLVLDEARKMVANPNCKERDRAAAMKILLDADKLNVAVTKLDQPPSPSLTGVAVQINNNSVTAAQVAAELLKTAEGREFLENACDANENETR